MPSTHTGTRQPGSPRRRTFGVAPYVAGRTTAEYAADGTLRAVEADDEVAALAAYAAAHGLTVTGDPVVAKRTHATLSDGRDYVSRYLRAAVAELLPPELVLDAPAVPRRSPARAADHEPAPVAGSADPEPAPAGEATSGAAAEPVPSPPEPPEYARLDALGPADLDAVRPSLQPLSWSVAAALWGAAGEAAQPVQVVAERFAVSPGFVRMVAASVLRLAADDASGPP